MAIRRTRKDKQRAQVHRYEELQYVLPDQPIEKSQAATESAEVEVPQRVSDAEPSLNFKLFGYHPNLVYNDLLKTLLVTITVVAILFGIFFLIR